MGGRPSDYRLSSAGPLRFYSVKELLFMDPPAWLIEDIVPENALVGLYAPPESLKSFLALDIAMCIATGTPFHGHEIQPGYVVYISAEGGAGMGKRVAAWMLDHDMDILDRRLDNIAFITETVNVNADSVEMAYLLQRLEEEVQREPVLVVIDTLARCFVGNENEQEDMGQFVAGVDVLRKRFGCSVLVVHHTRLDGERERGNTAFRGAADTMIAMNRTDDVVEVKCAKQKDAEHFADFALEKLVIPEADSCVLTDIDLQGRLVERAEGLLQVLRDHGPMRFEDWRVRADLTVSEMMKRFPRLREAKRIRKTADGAWEVAGETH